MFLSKSNGTFIVTTLALTTLAVGKVSAIDVDQAVVGKVSAVDVDVDPSPTAEFLPKYVPYNNGGITTLLVSYSDDAGHDSV
eukprot:scaffold2429_cov149-Skeletonema_menzelii.AAC.20